MLKGQFVENVRRRIHVRIHVLRLVDMLKGQFVD
jgi:hypothetical protein